ncbi:MAG: hypothetical protein IT326_08120 [Anaerolineae bacterium]|nr:hypothetical protein [Anaerolineae bacterium]
MTIRTDENIEKARQAIMRFRELLNIMQGRLHEGEHYYARLFDNCSEEDRANLQTKLLQRVAAHDVRADPTPLRRAALKMRFSSRELEKAFEELHDAVFFEEEDQS